MQGTTSIRTSRAVPSIAVPRNQFVNFAGNPTDARNQQNPSHHLPTRQEHADTSPSFGAARDAPIRANRLHPTHRDFRIDLWISLLDCGIMYVKKLDAMLRVKSLHTRSAGAAKAATSIVKNLKLRRALSPRAHAYSIPSQTSMAHHPQSARKSTAKSNYPPKLTLHAVYGKLDVYAAAFEPAGEHSEPPSGKFLAVTDTNGPKVHTQFLYHRAH
jgi:hypothetical protein